MIVLHNNKFVKDAKVSATGSFGRGYGIFETIRTFNDKELPLLDKHLKRFSESAKKINLKLKYSKKEIGEMIKKVTKKSPHKIQRIKLMATAEDLIIFSVKAKINPNIYNGVSLISTKISRSLPEVKSISYLPSFLAHKNAIKKSYFDALLINEKEEVFEAAYANIFWFEGNILCTRKDKILAGITREVVIKNSPFKIKFKNIKLKDLKKKSEIFITQSINLIVPITKIDNKKIGTGKPGTKTKKIIEKLKLILKNSSKPLQNQKLP
ncbi:hypothetical protein HN709_00345 [Candidatus Peregrinibacteria bacterium]|jgi:branched-chain amino acid aminotransferase|nr:hypothetical protein [Candidatus Peregrinibacteria bacterium]MBT7736119.1 hypothetical protein [Candidatus Peregrinibacteria bacterium]